MKKILFSIILAACTLLAKAQEKDLINDYSMIGVNYGVTFSNMYFSPTMHERAYVMAPNYLSIQYTKHCKMFDTMPLFALVVGASIGNEGFAFKPDKDTGVSANIDEVEWCSMRVLEVPAMGQIHFDIEPVKIMANIGIYGGWRQSISRRGTPQFDTQWAQSFRSYENRIDYGFQGGAGLGFIFDPIEIHFNCLVRWSWSSMYQPDYKSSYYYYYAYPLDIMATVGIHFHLTKRRGKTNRQIKQEAYNTVYGTN